MNMPVSIYTQAGHDDALFWWRAFHILQGDWLGNYNQMILAKGPGYSVFLALNAVIGVPITLSLALFYLGSCWVLFRTLALLNINKAFAVLLIALILFIPQLFPIRIIRDNIYPALTLFVFSGLLRVCFPIEVRIFRLIPFGLMLGFFWITREEGVWILPGIAVALLLASVFHLIDKNTPALKLILAKSAVFFGAGVVTVFCFSAINYSQYKTFSVVDFKDRDFSKSLNALNSIEVAKEISHVPVQEEKRRIAYGVSPAFATLESYFEDSGRGWTNPGCSTYPWTCGDYAGGWFMWAYRDAAAGRGHYQSAGQAKAFYKAVYKEISAACKSRQIRCKESPLPFLPKLSTEQLKQIPEKFLTAVKALATLIPASVDGGPSMGPVTKLENVRFFLRYPLSVLAKEEDFFTLEGWYYQHRDKWISLHCPGGADQEIARMHSPDIAIHTQDEEADSQRFSLKLLRDSGCYFTNGKDKLAAAKVISQGTGAYHLGNAKESGTLYLDRVLNIQDKYRQYAVKVKKVLASIYRVISPIIFGLGALVFLTYTLWPRSLRVKVTPLYVLTASLWALVISRICILILVDITSFPGINSLYLAPAYPLIFLAAGLSMLLTADLVRHLRQFQWNNTKRQ